MSRETRKNVKKSVLELCDEVKTALGTAPFLPSSLTNFVVATVTAATPNLSETETFFTFNCNTVSCSEYRIYFIPILNMNIPIAVGSKQRSLGEKRRGRKRPRNETMKKKKKKRFSALPFTIAGIAALCSPNASAFFHPAPLTTVTRNVISLRDKLDGTWESVDGRRSRKYGGSGAIVVSTTPASSSSLPPWLACAQDELAGLSSRAASKRVRREIELLEASLMALDLSKEDVRDIIRAIYWCASIKKKDVKTSEKISKLMGCVSFCRLLLQLEDDSFDEKKKYQYNNGDKNNNSKKGYLITKDFLLASILHYSECVDLRYNGMYDEVQRALYENSFLDNIDDDDDEMEGHLLESKITDNENTLVETQLVLPRDADGKNLDASIVLQRDVGDKNSSNDLFERIFSRESLKLASAATRLKRIEILTTVTLSDQELRRRPLTASEYAAARNLMVSMSDDWRALAIRCAASLYRLDGILKHSSGDFTRKNADSTLVAKDSLKMFANLSQQMGLHRLHSQLESKAFRILYPRQYSASSALFQEHGAAMDAIAGFLSNQLNQMLCEDLSLMYELENLEVVSRVKEPYSFWKKLLKTRVNGIVLSENNDEDSVDSTDGKISLVEQNGPQRQMMRSSPELSILEVNDGVALRVIFKARKLHVDEPPETTQERERILCYYIHHMVRSKWPETDQSKVKDYVRYPKPNGYQSLHHTSKITRNKQDFHFEIQVRSEEMHRIAEFGVAAHSAYKSGGSNSSPNIYPSLKSSTDKSSAMIRKSNSSNRSSTLTFLSKDENNASGAPVIEASVSGNAGPYIHALEKSRQTLTQSQVYVFLAGGSSSTLEDGQLITLSAGSLIVDVLETLRETNEEFDFEDHEVNVWCNGNIAGQEQTVKNGDMILIQPTPTLVYPPITEILVNKTSTSNTILMS